MIRNPQDFAAMIPKPLNQVTEADLHALIESRVPEGKTIDYKSSLPGSTDTDKKEFLADACSFANTSGGDLIYGIAEEKGEPTAIVGVNSGNLDLEKQRLDNLLATCIEPRIRHEMAVVECAEARKVLILRVERSWIGPHRVGFKGDHKFYGRNSSGKYPLDVDELRTAFTLSADIADRMRAFRVDRLIALSNNETPVPMEGRPKVVLHCMPWDAFAGPVQRDVLRLYARSEHRGLLGGADGTCRINFEGLLLHAGGDKSYTYTQIFRNGCLEVVHENLLDRGSGTYRYKIPSKSLEYSILKYLPFCTLVLDDIGCKPPISVMLALIGAKGMYLGVDPSRYDDGYPICHDPLIIPEAIIEDFSVSPGKVLKRLFDMLWNACGFRGTPYFDSEGNWKGGQ